MNLEDKRQHIIKYVSSLIKPLVHSDLKYSYYSEIVNDDLVLHPATSDAYFLQAQEDNTDIPHYQECMQLAVGGLDGEEIEADGNRAIQDDEEEMDE